MSGEHGGHDHHGDHAGHGHAAGSHAHGGAGHTHAHGASESAVLVAAVLTGLFMVVEAVGGVLSGSLALLADAGHMLTDFAALSLAWLGFRLARRPADWRRTYGFDRFSVLVAFVNGIALFAIAGLIVWEAAHRLSEPSPVLGGPMLAIAIAGLGVNLLAFWILSRGDRSQLNMRAALLHVAGDLLGSAAAILAALVILATGWWPVDPILSVLVALIILRSAWAVVRDAGHILLEGAPAGLEERAVESALRELPFVEDIHHVHVWSISEERPMITLHARVAPGAVPAETVAAIKRRLADRFGFTHATVEIETGPCSDAACGMAR